MSERESKAQNNWIDTFLQEAEHLLAEIDEAALALSEGETLETIHRIVRAFHTIEGSSGMCGLTAVADFTHHVAPQCHRRLGSNHRGRWRSGSDTRHRFHH